MSDTTPTPVAPAALSQADLQAAASVISSTPNVTFTPSAPSAKSAPAWTMITHELEPVLAANKDKIPPKARKVFYEVVGDVNAVATGVLAIAPFLPADARWVAVATGVCTFVCKFASAHVPTA